MGKTASQLYKLSSRATRLIEGTNFGYLATIMKDGSPQVTPVWVDYDGDLILVNTSVVRLKQLNSKRNPKVAIAIADASNQYDMVSIRGTVIEQTTMDAKQHIDKLAKKYLGRDQYPWLSPNETRIILKIKPERSTG